MLGFRVLPSAEPGRAPRPWRLFAARPGFLALGLLVVGCSAGAAGQDRSASPGAGGSANVENDGGEPIPASLAFSISETLLLAPGEDQVLEVVATPPGSYHVQFALLGADVNGGPGDAALDRGEADTDAYGMAQVQLTAPSTAAIFTVRASVGMSVSTELAVSVSDNGYGKIRVEPIYTGKRSVTKWIASVRDGQSCEDFGETPPPEGALRAEALEGEFPLVESVPVGPVLAVRVRAGNYIVGCSTLREIDAGETTNVTVSMTDRPIDLEGTQLEIALGLDEPAPEWNAANDEAIVSALSEFNRDSSDDVVLLLDTMQAEAGVAAFSSARTTELWDEGLRELWGSGAETRLRDAARRWLEQGARSFVGPDLLLGKLGPDGGDAELVLTSVAGHTPKEAGFTTTLVGAWSADPSDTLFLGTSLLWVPSKLLTTLALEPAIVELPEVSSVAAGLALVAGCLDAADDLVSLGTVADEAYASCDSACLRELCEAAVNTLWERARDAGTTTPMPATLAVTASGAVTVGDDATAVRLEGSWVGQLQSGANAATAGGKLTAVEPAIP